MPKVGRLGLSLLVASFLVGCGDHVRLISESPDGRAKVIASAPRGFGPAFRVVLIQDRKEHELYVRQGFEALYWLEVYWDPGGKHVGVLTCSDPNLYLALDRRTLKSIPFSTVESAIKQQLVRKFGVREFTGEDWKAEVCLACCTPEALKRREAKTR